MRDVIPERLGEDDEEEKVESEDEPPVDENPLASVQTLTKIREALSGLSQEELQLLVKGVAVTQPLQIDEKAAATAALDQAVRTFLWDALDDSTRKLYLSIESDPTVAQDGVWTRIFQASDRSRQNYCPTFQSMLIIRCLIGVPRRLHPTRSARFALVPRKPPQMMFFSRFRASLCPSSCDS